jgi:CDP-glycerol glycerophosphotransferase
VPRISVVVPIYNVEEYLDACLRSIATQTFADLEVIVVDDGSTDGSAAIAQRWVEKDQRFRLITQPNGGLGNARNTGTDAATGEFLAYVDSDDLLPRRAYQLLIRSLDKTGSDFATGNVFRLSRTGTKQAPFLAKTFTKTRPKTHVTEFRPLIFDRIVPNKLWRRSFWDAQGFRHPEGMLHEDIPVVLPAQFAAKSVDVIAEPVYLYRVREGGALSITQRRAEERALSDRVKAVEHVSEWLGKHGPRGARRWYEESVVAEDLRYYLNVLDAADDSYRALFLERVNHFLDRAHKRVYAPLRAIERLKWHLIRERRMPELLEVLRFQKEDIADTPPVQIDGKWYGDYPFRTDPELSIPLSIYELDSELELAAQVEAMRLEDGGGLRLEGFAYVSGVGAAERGAQTVSFTALRQGPLQRVRLRLSTKRWRGEAVHRPDAMAKARQSSVDLSWSGFTATVDPRGLRMAGRWWSGSWELYPMVRVGRLKRRRVNKLVTLGPVPLEAVDLPAGRGRVLVKAYCTWRGGIALDVQRHWATLRGHNRAGGVLELSGDIRMGRFANPKLELVRRGDELALTFPIEVRGGRFSARVPLDEIAVPAPPGAHDTGLEVGDEPSGLDDDRIVWDVQIVAGRRHHPVVLPADVRRAAWPLGDRELSLLRTRDGDAALAERSPRTVVARAAWTPDGALELSGTLPPGAPAQELVLIASEDIDRNVFPMRCDLEARTFSTRVTPAHIDSLAGDLPLREGIWGLYSRAADAGATAEVTPIVLDQDVYEHLPLETETGGKAFALGATRDERAILVVQRDLADDERGGYHQRRLRESVYRSARSEPLRDAVVYTSFDGRAYADNPRAIHEQLVRRDAPLEHLWVVRDGACRVPHSAAVVRADSREHHEALARARYVVTNDYFPEWFERRPDQVCLQTWHGTPLKRIGLEAADVRAATPRFRRHWEQQVKNWQHVVSPNRPSTPILRQAYAIEGELLETGYPRVDLLLRPDREAAAAALRRRLGVPEGVRTVLYAPTYRDHIVDRRGRYRLDMRLDLEKLHEALGDDTVMLFRKHPYVAETLAPVPNGFVRDVSRYPDGTELLLAADVLVTDYSSIMFDFANTGRPMLFFAYDLDAYREEIRGFNLDYRATVPGPVLRKSADVAEALRDLDAVRAEHAARYDEFVARFCEFDDGRATERVVERVFAPVAAGVMDQA